MLRAEDRSAAPDTHDGSEGSSYPWQLGTGVTLGGLLTKEGGYEEAPQSPTRAELLPGTKLQANWAGSSGHKLAFPRADL